MAAKWGWRPTAVISGDPYFGNRDPFSGEPVRDADVPNDWDLALASAFQLKEDLTDQYGLLAYEVDNERMDVLAIKKIDKFKAARDRATSGGRKKTYVPEPGEVFTPKLLLRGGEWPTLEEYWQKLADEAHED